MRQFISELEPDDDGCILVQGKKAHHLAEVLRVKAGDMVYARLPESGLLQPMTVAKVDGSKKTVLLQVAGELLASDSDGTKDAVQLPEIWLFQFVAKPPKMDLIIRQATECGVTSIVPVEGKFCQGGSVESARKKTEPKDDRWSRIISEAREQSGSAVETKVLPCVKLEEALEMALQEKLFGIVLYEQTGGTKTLGDAVSAMGEKKKAALFVGAEGGIAAEEVEIMQEKGIVPVHFATNILRCESAALYGTAVLQNALVEKELWKFKG
ncbi:MAG: 16S rRNA (uracil(1498)-N(3))-methyltransferase [Treponema sp.]|nr:16S rRNA (uracil(1498)-N(3))-methyltransferase [Treponema sp.]